MKKLLIFLLVLVQFSACKEDPLASLVEMDLMKHGIPVKIKAPKDATVIVTDMGLIKDVTISSKEMHYALQLMTSGVTEYDLDKIVREELETVENDKYFSKIISQEEAGFIFEKNIDGKLNYDFRLIKIQGEYEFDFQRSLIGNYSLSEVQLMFESVK